MASAYKTNQLKQCGEQTVFVVVHSSCCSFITHKIKHTCFLVFT